MADQEDYHQELERAIELVKEAGKIANEVLVIQKDYFTKSGPTDLVTETDQQLEKLIFNGLKESFPNHQFIGEESTAESGCKINLTDEPTWIVDPIDGTMNFVHGFPYVAISVALVVKKETKVAVVFDVAENHLYTAVKSKGAYRDNIRIHAVDNEDLNKALILTEVPRTKTVPYVSIAFKNVENVFNNSHNVRALGSAVIAGCYVASGYADAYFAFQLECWDVAAISLLVKEAGGKIMNPCGGPFDMLSKKFLCACSSSVASSLSSIIKDPYKRT